VEECRASAALASALARETATPPMMPPLPTDCIRKSVPERARRTSATSAREAGEAISPRCLESEREREGAETGEKEQRERGEKGEGALSLVLSLLNERKKKM